MYETFIGRLVDEQVELTCKIDKAKEFQKTEQYKSLSMSEKAMLSMQINAMDEYAYYLQQRITFYGRKNKKGKGGLAYEVKGKERNRNRKKIKKGEEK